VSIRRPARAGLISLSKLTGKHRLPRGTYELTATVLGRCGAASRPRHVLLHLG
jgi:hypothetical protein